MIISNNVGYLGPEDIKDEKVAKEIEAAKAKMMEDERPVLLKTGFSLSTKELRFLRSIAAREEVGLNRVIRAIIKRWLEAQRYSYPIGLIADRPGDFIEMDFRPDDGPARDYNDDVVGE